MRWVCSSLTFIAGGLPPASEPFTSLVNDACVCLFELLVTLHLSAAFRLEVSKSSIDMWEAASGGVVRSTVSMNFGATVGVAGVRTINVYPSGKHSPLVGQVLTEPHLTSRASLVLSRWTCSDQLLIWRHGLSWHFPHCLLLCWKMVHYFPYSCLPPATPITYHCHPQSCSHFLGPLLQARYNFQTKRAVVGRFQAHVFECVHTSTYKHEGTLPSVLSSLGVLSST